MDIGEGSVKTINQIKYNNDNINPIDFIILIL